MNDVGVLKVNENVIEMQVSDMKYFVMVGDYLLILTASTGSSRYALHYALYYVETRFPASYIN